MKTDSLLAQVAEHRKCGACGFESRGGTTSSFRIYVRGNIIVRPATPIVDHALAAADLGLKVFPIIPLSKRPLHEGWQDEVTTDPEAILEMFRQDPRANYGIATGSVNDIFVVDLDGEPAIRWWAAQGFAPGAVVTTPSGGKHVYYRMESTEIQTNQGKLFKEGASQVDIRGEGGLVVGPGSMLATGIYSGDLSNIPDAPDELLAIIPERQTFEYTPYEGEQVEAATESETRQISAIVKALQDLPREWAPGAGWHDVVFRSACWLSRMVNSGAYALNEEQAASILFTHTPTYPEWGDDQIWLQWESARKSTVGQFADLPEEIVPDLPPFLDVVNLLPEYTTKGRDFFELVTTEPEVKTSGAFWDQRNTIMLECLRAGLTDEQTAAVAWGAKVSQGAFQTETHAMRTLFRDLAKAKARVASEGGAGATPPPAEERPGLAAAGKGQKVLLLSDLERELVASDAYRWWGDRYMEWAETRVTMMNAPYHRMNRWTILSLVFSQYGFIPLKKGPMGLNLFQMVLGKTTTGKTEALEIMRSVIRACFPPGDSPNIGGDASPNALIEKLIERNGKPSWFNADEAHGLFEEMKGSTWRAGLLEKWTELYEGRVPMILRNMKADVSGVDATTHFVMYLMGTQSGMTDVLDAKFWTSGFLARYVWAIGEDMEVSVDDIQAEQQEGDVTVAYEAMPKQWAGEFAESVRKLTHMGKVPRPMLMEADALARHTKLMRELHTMFKGHRQEELLKPTTIRFANSVWKCAALVALSEAAPKITLRHELIALEQAEEWLTNIVLMVNQTTASAFTRQVDSLETFIARQRSGEIRKERIYTHLQLPVFEADKLIAQLFAEGRIEKIPTRDESTIIRIKTEGALAA